MKTISDIILKIICEELICMLFIFSGVIYGAEPIVEKQLPPPVNMEFTAENTPEAGKEIILKLKVTPLEDMHAEISCLLPQEIEPIIDNNVRVKLYKEKQPISQNLSVYKQKIVFYTGPLKGGIAREYLFRIKVSDIGKYELIGRAEALAKWRIKDNKLVLNIK